MTRQERFSSLVMQGRAVKTGAFGPAGRRRLGQMATDAGITQGPGGKISGLAGAFGVSEKQLAGARGGGGVFGGGGQFGAGMTVDFEKLAAAKQAVELEKILQDTRALALGQEIKGQQERISQQRKFNDLALTGIESLWETARGLVAKYLPDQPAATKPKVSVTINRIEVESNDPDRFVFGMVEAFRDYRKNPGSALSSAIEG